KGLWPTRCTKAGVWVSGDALAGSLRCGHGLSDPCRQCAAANARPVAGGDVASRSDRRRCPGRRPRVLFLRTPGFVGGAWGFGGVSRASEADRRLSAAPPGGHIPVAQARPERIADIALAEASGPARPTGRVSQAQDAPRLDERGRLRRVARNDSGARTTLPDYHA